MTIDVASLVEKEIGSNRGSQCATCGWLRGRPDEERARWSEQMRRTRDEVPHASIHAAMVAAAKIANYRMPASVSSVRKHRVEQHDVA